MDKQLKAKLAEVIGPTAAATLLEDLLPKGVVCFGLYFLGYFHLHTFLVIISFVYVFMSFALHPKTAQKIKLLLTPFKAGIFLDLIFMSNFPPKQSRVKCT